MGAVNDDDILKQLGKGKRREGVNSKSKGKAGEHSIVKFLNDLTGHNFMRVPNSGAMVGASNRDRLIKMTKGQVDVFLGDIICPEDTKYRWVIESKNYADIPIHGLLSEKKECKEIFEFLNQLEHDVKSLLDIKAEKREHLALLFMKITRKGEYAIFNEKHWGNTVKGIKTDNCLVFRKKSEIESYGSRYIMTDFKTFFSKNKDILF